MNKKNKTSIKEYFISAFVSFLILLAISMFVELELMFRSEKKVNFNELNIENLSKFCTIEELERKLLKNPDDFILNIRLGAMYESLNKLDRANDYYKTALKLSSRSNFALYSYAMFCARHDLFAFAATLAEELSGNNKRSNFLKAKIYEQIADNLDKKKNYAASTKAYQIVYKYAKSIGDLEYIYKTKNKYSDEYIKLADYNLGLGEVEEAISNLKNSIRIKKNALAYYKLGLIYMNIDGFQAEKYIYSAFSKNPYVVNPTIYYSLLQKLIDDSLAQNNNRAQYYSSRLSRFKNKVSELYLFKDELIIDNSAFFVKKIFLRGDKKILFFEIKNATDKELKSLYLKAQIFVNGKSYDVEKNIIHRSNPLDAYDTLQYKDFVLPDDIKLDSIQKNNDIFVKYYAKKTKNAPWILMKIDFIDI